LLLALMVAGWIAVAVLCAVWVGTAIRSAETEERAVRPLPETAGQPSRAEELGFVQTSLFDVPATDAGVLFARSEPVAVS
jgi:hypothetical protein